MDNAKVDEKEVIADLQKKKRHITPSVKQIKALQLVSQGYSKRRAMIEAGYSLSTANHKSDLVTKSRAAKQITEAMKSGLMDRGLDIDFMLDKFVKWMNAKKSDKEDYKTQLGAYKQWKEIMEPKEDQSRKPSRRITFEEFIGEKDETKLPEMG